MNRNILGLILLLTLSFIQLVFAGGTQDGGGGSEEAKMFMTTARAKVMLLVGNSKTSKFGLQLLEAIESRPKIKIVPSLNKTCDGKALTSYYAYSCTGEIFLLHSTWASKKDGGRGWLQSSADADEHWQDILHELARASNALSTKFVTNDEGFTETTKPEVMETINRNSRMNIDIVTPSKADIRNSLDQYIQTISTFGIGDDVIESPWTRINDRDWYQVRSSESIAKNTALEVMRNLTKDDFKSRINSVVKYDSMQKCNTSLPHTKFGFNQQQINAATEGTSFSSYYRNRGSARDGYCAEDAAYAKASVRISSKLKTVDQDLQQFLIALHIQKTTQDMIGSIQEFVRGLGAIEVNPVISSDRFASFGIKSSSELHTWMDYHVSRVRLALAYVKFVDRLNLGFEIKSLTYNLRQQSVGALRKLNQFEDPAIYIVMIDYENGRKPTVSPVFELSQLRALVQAADIGLPAKGTTIIRNRSRVEAAGFTANLTVQLRCDEVFARMSSESASEKVIDGSNEFKASAAFLLSRCADRYFVKDQSATDESTWGHGETQEETKEAARVGAVNKLKKMPDIPNCAAYEIISASGDYANSSNYFIGTGTARIRWVCPRPSTSLNQ